MSLALWRLDSRVERCRAIAVGPTGPAGTVNAVSAPACRRLASVAIKRAAVLLGTRRHARVNSTLQRYASVMARWCAALRVDDDKEEHDVYSTSHFVARGNEQKKMLQVATDEEGVLLWGSVAVALGPGTAYAPSKSLRAGMAF
ncbi:hypothetical protein NL676_014741 [Syzygium grande]|nr:hypothetical protein NL676_014741 [Syzygium grande]